MCGIFGYVGTENAQETIINGLKRLEYRGYDSWGVAVKHNGSLDITKKVGAIGDIEISSSKTHACVGIGHTRWATHGGTTQRNAHPHLATDKSFVLAQNGIVENYQELKTQLKKKGYKFTTETDTEVIVRLVEEKKKSEDSLREAVRQAFLELKGRNTIILMTTGEDHIIAIRNGSPLVVGLGDNEYFFSSDTLSFADKTDRVFLIDDNQIVEYKEEQLGLFNAMTGRNLTPKITKLDHKATNIDKEGFDHYMLKEIVEQKDTIREAIQYTEDEYQPLVDAMKKAGMIYTVGAGTAGFAAGQIAYFIRKYAGLHAIEMKSYETDSYRNLFKKGDVVIGVSQSGETADTLEALEIAKDSGATIASIVNMVGSTTTRMSTFPYFTRSGPEICVASTKAFTAQVAWGLVLAHTVAGKYEDGVAAINEASEKLNGYFTQDLFGHIRDLAKQLTEHNHCFVLGKGAHYNIALEGALKVKEITYKHFEGFAAGELKHGVIALIENGTPVFVIVSDDEYKDDMLTAAAEVKSRGAWTIGIANEQNDLFSDYIRSIDGGPADPITKVVPFQLLSYFLGVELGNNIDRPRNLAKSVTVK
jgi:glutamine---fructose-6-phosphate transaminase (isomerizing)